MMVKVTVAAVEDLTLILAEVPTVVALSDLVVVVLVLEGKAQEKENPRNEQPALHLLNMTMRLFVIQQLFIVTWISSLLVQSMILVFLTHALKKLKNIKVLYFKTARIAER
jgi:hypothetical protein